MVETKQPRGSGLNHSVQVVMACLKLLTGRPNFILFCLTETERRRTHFESRKIHLGGDSYAD